MFYVFSKLVSFLFKPLNLVVLCGLFAFLDKNKIRQKKWALSGFLLFLIFTNNYLIHQLSDTWQTGHTRPELIPDSCGFGILLGGYSDFTAQSMEGIEVFSRTGNRLWQTLSLYKTGKIKRIFLSGGSGLIIGQEKNEADEVKHFLIELGVPAGDIFIDRNSRNTHENARFTKAALDTMFTDSQKLVLITSDWHMRRAQGCFQKEGLNTIPFGCDTFAETARGNFFHWIEPDWDALMKWEALIKEWIGYAIYRWKGYL